MIETFLDELKTKKDRAYAQYVMLMQTDECRGWEIKSMTGYFGQAEYNAHAKAYELLGKHRAYAEVYNTLVAMLPANHDGGKLALVRVWSEDECEEVAPGEYQLKEDAHDGKANTVNSCLTSSRRA